MTCPVCEGRKVTAEFVRSKPQTPGGGHPRYEYFQFLSYVIPVLGELVDRKCGYCKGEGRMPDEHQ
jgi:hypothetical protein